MDGNAAGRALEKVGGAIRENSPSILVGVGIALFGTTVFLVAKETPKAQKLMQEKRIEIAGSDPATRPELEKLQVIAAGAKAYIPAMVSSAGAIFCFVYANKLNLDRQTALIGAYTLADKTLATYKEEVKKQLSPKKADELEEAVAQRQLDDNPVEGKEIFVIGNEDQQLCMDSMSGRYFRASISDIREAEYQVNKEMVTGIGDVVFLDMLYEQLGLPSIEAGEIMGWDIQHGDRLEIKLRNGTASNGQPCWVLEYDVRALVMQDW